MKLPSVRLPKLEGGITLGVVVHGGEYVLLPLGAFVHEVYPKKKKFTEKAPSVVTLLDPPICTWLDTT
jgi:hypothetical protein